MVDALVMNVDICAFEKETLLNCDRSEEAEVDEQSEDSDQNEG